ncbi:hypothetical protein [Ferruginibacter sp.]|uniref:hypothetical protein n=1 Tax=Ferruginibacter sp. TaxID=1940288 RepID=UPI00374CCF86
MEREILDYIISISLTDWVIINDLLKSKYDDTFCEQIRESLVNLFNDGSIEIEGSNHLRMCLPILLNSSDNKNTQATLDNWPIKIKLTYKERKKLTENTSSFNNLIFDLDLVSKYLKSNYSKPIIIEIFTKDTGIGISNPAINHLVKLGHITHTKHNIGLTPLGLASMSDMDLKTKAYKNESNNNSVTVHGDFTGTIINHSDLDVKSSNADHSKAIPITKSKIDVPLILKIIAGVIAIILAILKGCKII